MEVEVCGSAFVIVSTFSRNISYVRIVLEDRRTKTGGLRN